MTDSRDGSVVTFYSYKGGTGRSMALANVAWILAANGKRVLVADWDLESPGLHRFFKPFLEEDDLNGAAGVIDMIREYEWQTTREIERPDDWYEEYAKAGLYAFSINWQFPAGGSLDFLSAGRQNDDYAVTVGALEWDNFYERLQGARFFDALRADMKRNYDFALIDSRTGLSDVADICTLHLPDVLVDCFTLSDQGIEGAARVARKVRSQRSRLGRQPRILPVPMRVDQAEKEKAEAGRAVAARRFMDLPTDKTESERRQYWSEVEVPYRPFYAYEETLAVFGDQPGSRTSLLAAYEVLTSHITGERVSALPTMDEAVRLREKGRFERRSPELIEEALILRYAPEDQIWAEWIERLLSAAGAQVVDPRLGAESGEEGATTPFRTLNIISAAYLAADPGEMPLADAGTGPPVAVYIADLRPLPEFHPDNSVTVVNLSASIAAERILGVLGWPRSMSVVGDAESGIRYPGAEPSVLGAPARNARFTGREEELQQLRHQLQSGGRAVVLPVALHGMGGVGKTQLALEYVHRFRSAYDIVWWIQADPPQFVDVAVADLAPRLKVPQGDTAADTAKAVLQALRSGEAARRWLLVYDNAEDLETIGPFIPQSSNGHVLITSRNAAWSDRSHPISIDVFQRHESIAHLRRRVDEMSEEEANSIAEMLGDLPIAVSAAGAWLAETGVSPGEYLRQVQESGPRTESVQKVWQLSLERLKEQSPAAYRLLEFCSVLAPEIALDLLTSDEMAAALVLIDPSMSERIMRGAPIQQMNRLALVRLDSRARQVQVHRLLQAVVRERMSEAERGTARHQVHLVLARFRPGHEVDDRDTWPQYRQIWPHLEFSGAIDCDAHSVRQLLIDRVRYLFLRGDLLRGEAVAKRILAAWQPLLLKEGTTEWLESLQREVLHLRFNLANILRAQGRFDEARKIDEEVLETQQALLGEHHSHTLMTAGGLAADLRALGRYGDALPRDEATYRAWLEVLGEDSSRSLTAASNLAVSYRQVGDFRSARRLDEQVYNRRRAMLGAEHLGTLTSASGLGRDLREAGEYERSVVRLQDVFSTYRDRYGADDGETLLAQANLAVSLRAAGHPDKAGPLLDDAYQRLVDFSGPTGPVTLACRLSRAANLLVLGDLEVAEAEMTSVSDAYRGLLGPSHPHTLVCQSNLSVAAYLKGDTEVALQRAEATATDFTNMLEDSHPYTLAASMNAATFLVASDRPAVASERMREIAELMTRSLGLTHPDTICCRAHIVITAGIADGRDSAAVVGPIVRQLAESIGTNHPTVRNLQEGRLSQRILDPNPY